MDSVIETKHMVKTTKDKTYTLLEPLSYAACFWINMCIFYLLGHVSVDTLCRYIMYVLNVPISVNVLILVLLTIFQYEFITGYSNANIGSWSVGDSTEYPS